MLGYKKYFRAGFFIGAMLFLIGLGIYIMGHAYAGVALMCVSIAPIVIGFFGLVTMITIDMKMVKKK